jgi:hypothetical protein
MDLFRGSLKKLERIEIMIYTPVWFKQISNIALKTTKTKMSRLENSVRWVLFPDKKLGSATYPP